MFCLRQRFAQEFWQVHWLTRGGLSQGMSNPIDNSYWVDPDVLLAGEHPGDPGDDTTRKSVRRLLVTGVSQFIDLTTRGELPSYESLLQEEAKTLGVEVAYSNHPVRRQGIPRSPVQTAAIIREIAEARSSGMMTYLHGAAGVGRVGLVVGCFLVETGLSGNRALNKLQILYSAMEKSAWEPDIPATEQQADYVREWLAGQHSESNGE
jgi:hypothetical protein